MKFLYIRDQRPIYSQERPRWTDALWALALGLLAAMGAASAGVLDPFEWARADRIEVNIPWLPFENETRCYADLGCLNITRSWYHLIHRPFNVFPLPREIIDTKFFLYTKKNPSEGHRITADSNKTIAESHFDASKPTKFIIHGFIDTSMSSWIAEMKTELLKSEDVNVIVVDWAGGSLPLYTQATANTRLVGMEIANLIKYLQKNYGLEPQDIHLIGHSLGAHTAGYTGAIISGLGRITGLDPAEPYFQGMPTHVRLDPSDAEFVDVIHTDGKSILFLGYGMSQPCGHVDFYPNNGKEQPGCDLSQAPLVPLTLIREGLEEASRVLVACNHVRAIKLFIDSINSQCPYIGHQCSNFNQFLDGKCFNCKSGECAMMGYHAVTANGLQSINDITPPRENHGQKYFLMTGRDFPYCQRHYRIAIQLARPPEAENWVQGSIKMTIFGESGIIHDLDLTNNGYSKYEHGNTYTVVVIHPTDLAGKMRKIEVNWEYDMNVLDPKSLCLFWCNDHLFVKSISIDEMEMPGRRARQSIKDYSNQLCPSSKKGYADIPNKRKVAFFNCS